MTTIENVNYTAMHAELDRQDAAQSATERAFESLRAEFVAAFRSGPGPLTEVRTPKGAGQPGLRTAPLYEVVCAMIDDEPGIVTALLGMCESMASFGNPAAVELRDKLARQYADAFCLDLVQEQGE
jgi:hypothetical protein